ncbi:MAG: PmoA family protein [Sedimentisphaerales bacterium]|nr:PmoA family protein [Sedimentisphaerales bacterium]
MCITMEADAVSISQGQQSLLCYRYEDVPFKPYVQKLFSPSGINILRDAPHDHLHHHALMYAVAVDGVNFWEEQTEPGRELHKRFDDMRIDKIGNTTQAGFTEQLDWINPRSGKLLLKEHRKIKVCQLDDVKATLLSWQSSLEVPLGKKSMTLSGSHYFGLGMRFLESMDTGGKFLIASDQAGDIVRGTERITRADWCAYTAEANGKPVTIAMFGHPENLRHPTHWFTMTEPFVYLAATLNLHKEPLAVNSETPLVLRYAVAVWDGRVDKSKIEQVYQRWVDSQ